MARAERRADALGFGNSFSAYIAKLIRDDIAERGALSETPTTYKIKRADDPPKRKAG